MLAALADQPGRTRGAPRHPERRRCPAAATCTLPGRMGLGLLIAIVIVGLLALAVILIYNRMVSRRNAVDNSWGQIEAALQRRHDLIPNLVEAVKGYATHERETFENVTQARGAAAGGRRGDAQRRARQAAGGGRELPGPARDRELPAAAAGAERYREPDRDHPPGLQRHRADLQHRDPDLPQLGDRQRFKFEPRAFFDAPTEAEATPQVSFEQGAQTGATEAGAEQA